MPYTRAGGQLIGSKIMGMQAQDISPNVGIKNKLSTSNKPLMVPLVSRPYSSVGPNQFN